MTEKETNTTLNDRLPNIHPGEVIREEFMVPLGMTAYQLSRGIGMQQTAVTQILRGERSITAATAHKLSRFLGCSPDFWLGLQMDYDLEEAALQLGPSLDAIRRYDEGHTDKRRGYSAGAAPRRFGSKPAGQRVEPS